MTPTQQTVVIEPHNLYKYVEVFEILEWRNGMIFATRSLNKFALRTTANPDPKRWYFASPSMRLLKAKTKTVLCLWS
jgi:hypothetical protein